MPFLVFLDQKLEKTIVIFGISILEFAEMQKNAQNKKNQIWDENVSFSYFGL